MDTQEQEVAFVKRFIVESKHGRYLQFLSKPKARWKFLRDIAHCLMFKGSLVTELSPKERTPSNVARQLQMLGAGEFIYIIAPYPELDQQWFPLKDGLTHVFGTGQEAILCCMAGQLAFVQSEDSAYMLHYEPQR